MKSRIRILDDHTINQIAAGEVIENPSSVIKELVENSCDAGASKVTVEIKGGGRQLIRVSDDGYGMSPDDAVLCLDRHATSKIKLLEDLEGVATMGFRGEAIPSIASISKMTILTSTATSDSDSTPVSTLVVVEGGKIIRQSSAVRSIGTTIEVKALFFNVPVRRKFQRSPTADANEILKIMVLLALAHPAVRFELIHEEKTILQTSQGGNGVENLKIRIKEVVGEDFIDSCLPVKHEWDQFALEGYIGQPGQSRHNRGGQYLLINSRPVTSPQIAAVIAEAYGTRIDIGRFPLFALRLKVPGEFLDVNVHPQKKTVRIRQEGPLREGILFCIEQALQKQGVARASAVYSSPLPKAGKVFEAPAGSSQSFFREFKPREDWKPFNKRAFSDSYNKCDYTSLSVEASSDPSLDLKSIHKNPKVLGMVDSYLILDPGSHEYFGIDFEGVVFIDQHRAHFCVIYEALLQQSEAGREKKISADVQSLLLPLSIGFTMEEALLVEQKSDLLAALGIFLRKETGSQFALTAVPCSIKFSEAESYVREVIENLKINEEQNISHQEKLRAFACTAYQAAIPRRKRISLLEAEALISQLLKCRQFLFDPFGKPLVAAMKSEEIAQRFSM